MLICKVIGHVWATKKQDGMEGFKLMVVREVETNTHRGDTFVAADTVGAGIGEHVLVVDGSTARRALGGDDFVVDCAIVAIIDTIEMQREENSKLHLDAWTDEETAS